MKLDDLTGPITELAIAWSEGDRESGEILFRRIIRYLRPAAGRIALQCPDRSTTDVLNEAYEQLCKDRPRKFENRQRFLGSYIQAMKFWLGDYRRYMQAQKRKGMRIGTASDLSAPSDERTRNLLMDLDRSLNRLKANGLIEEETAELFIYNRIMGVSQTDLAELLSLARQTVAKRINLVTHLVQRELAEYVYADGA